MTAPQAFSYIRFSSPEQEKGDSLRRQTEASAKYATEHGLVLDDSTRMTDRGLSAFTGEHRTKGALGEFLRLVGDGRIPKGSVLLVEHIDRLSREHVLDALTQFTSIIKAGIKVVTLRDGMEYDQDSITQNPIELITSILYMVQAHDASAMKAERIAAAWERKRELARNEKRILTRKGPEWIGISKDGKRFVLLTGRAAIVRWIYEMRAAGLGTPRIERKLNSVKRDIWRPERAGSWRRSYIVKILCSKAVVGEYQPYREVKGKRQPVGDPIPNYYPAAVPLELFYRVQNMIARNRGMKGYAGGRTGQVTNLFTHIMRCSVCGGSMAVFNKGAYYLQCDTARRKAGCTSTRSVRYDEVESLVLDFCKGLNARDILPSRVKQRSETVRVEDELEAVQGVLSEAERAIGNVTNSIAKTDKRGVQMELESRMETFLSERARLRERKVELEARREQLREGAQTTEEQLKDMHQLTEHVKTLPEDQVILVRLELRAVLRRLLDHMVVYSDSREVTLFFSTGERRLLSLVTRKVVRDAYLKKASNRL